MTAQTKLGQHLLYRPHVGHFIAKIQRSFSPRLVPGVHFAFNGPVHDAVQTFGNLTALDFLQLRVCNILGLSNGKLEIKLRAIGNAFRREAELLELS